MITSRNRVPSRNCGPPRGWGRPRQAQAQGCHDGQVLAIAELLTDLNDATAALVTDLAGLTDAQVGEPSLLPGWSRGHVLTHLARNPEGGTKLLTWARSGVPSYEYRSVAARAQAIEDRAGRPASELSEDVQRTADELAEAAAAMPPDAWPHEITWTTGQQTPAATFTWTGRTVENAPGTSAAPKRTSWPG